MVSEKRKTAPAAPLFYFLHPLAKQIEPSRRHDHGAQVRGRECEILCVCRVMCIYLDISYEPTLSLYAFATCFKTFYETYYVLKHEFMFRHAFVHTRARIHLQVNMQTQRDPHAHLRHAHLQQTHADATRPERVRDSGVRGLPIPYSTLSVNAHSACLYENEYVSLSNMNTIFLTQRHKSTYICIQFFVLAQPLCGKKET
jgi:hypothetical protein